MTFTSSSRLLAGALASAGLIAACGSPAITSPVVTPATPSPSPSASSSAGGGATNATLKVALSVSDLPSSLSSYVQTSDGLLGTTPNTDSRVFASSDNTTRVEIDIAGDTGASAATSDYSAYQSAAAKQVSTATSTSTPKVGQQANEYVGTDSSGHSATSLSFVEGSYIVVVTMVSSSGTVDPTVVEAIAGAQDTKITSAGG